MKELLESSNSNFFVLDIELLIIVENLFIKGQSALHLAIVNQDPYMVRTLLVKNANVHQRCCGKFFLPDDQKNSFNRRCILFSDYSCFPQKTNYIGNFYYGEYPLSFAALLNQHECIRLLLAKGADFNKQDSNGNTVLHMLVIYDNLVNFSEKISCFFSFLLSMCFICLEYD